MYIKVQVTPKARKEEVSEDKPGYYTISVREKAERNLANTRVREIIAEHYRVAVGKVQIVNGHHSPSKLIVVDV